MARMSAEDRRVSVISAAMSEFAQGGYKGTSTEAIARRVGVSQPYLFRLFPNKQAMFIAAAEQCLAQTREVFAKAVEGIPMEERLPAMGMAYKQLLRDDPEKLLMQMQMYAAVAAAEAGGDHDFGSALRVSWQQMWDEVRAALGTDIEETTEFFAHGMLINTLVSLGIPPNHPNWECFHVAARPEE